MSMNMGCCPECDADIVIRTSPYIGQELTCRSCYAFLIIVGLTPVELDWVHADDQIRLGDDDFYSQVKEYEFD